MKHTKNVEIDTDKALPPGVVRIRGDIIGTFDEVLELLDDLKEVVRAAQEASKGPQ